MKRALKKKVKAVPGGAPNEDAVVGYLKPVNPRVNRRVRTRAAMIGLAISMGASSLLLTRQSDQALAAEPVGNDPAATTVPATSDAETVITPNHSVEPEVVQSVSVVKTAAKVEPEAVSPVSGLEAGGKVGKRAVVVPTRALTAPATSASPEIASTVQEGQRLGQLSQKNQLADKLIAAKKAAQLSNLQVEQVPSIPQADGNLEQESDLGETVVTPSIADDVEPSLSTSSPTAESQTVSESGTVAADTNALLKAKQELALKRLKQKSNRLQESLAELRSEETNDLSVPATELAEPVEVEPTEVEPAEVESAEVVEETPTSDPEVAASQQPEPEVVTDESTLSDSEQLQEKPVTIAVPALPKTAVAAPTVILPAVGEVYQVQPGDTLAAIARRNGVSVFELVKVNNLSDPNRLKISQQLTIPQAGINPTSQTETTTVPRIAVPPVKTASINPNVPLALRLSATGVPPVAEKNSTVAVPTPSAFIDEIQANPESVASNPTAASPSESVTVTAPNPYGVGGTFPQTTASAETLLAKKPVVTKAKVPSNPYVENLRTEIERLREKYRAQQNGQPGSVVVPVVTETNNAAVQITVPKPTTPKLSSEPINPEFLPNRAEEQTSRAARNRVATAPVTVDASESLQSMRGSTVSPQLPPLAAVDTYLPRPIDETTAPSAGFIWPTKGVLTSGYGRRWGRMHKGIDIAAPVGTPIFAAAQGVVVKAGWNKGGFGKLVDIRHADGTLTRYAHNNRILVRAGQEVEQGQQISEMGSTGYSTGPHLHFEIHPSGRGAVNPVAFLPPRPRR